VSFLLRVSDFVLVFFIKKKVEQKKIIKANDEYFCAGFEPVPHQIYFLHQTIQMYSSAISTQIKILILLRKPLKKLS
jgi:hypothetical protein